MNPPTPGPLTVLLVPPAGPLTVLLVPPAGDTALLAPEWCGGRVPEMHRDVLAPPGWSPRPAPDWHIEGVSPTYDRALVLALDDVPVAVGCDRAMRWCRNHPDREKTGIYWPQPHANWTIGLAKDLADFAARLGARVVLLRDGLEVPQ